MRVSNIGVNKRFMIRKNEEETKKEREEKKREKKKATMDNALGASPLPRINITFKHMPCAL